MPPGVNPQAWLNKRERRFWKERFDALNPPLKFEAQEPKPPHHGWYHRARRQLLDWGRNVKSSGDGYCWEKRDKEKPRVHGGPLQLKNRFDPKRDWRIEFTIEWDKRDYPGYFAVAAGKIQAGFGYHPNISFLHGGRKVKWRGSVAGAALFEHEDMAKGHVGHFDDFHWHMVNPKEKKGFRRKKIQKKEKAYILEE